MVRNIVFLLLLINTFLFSYTTGSQTPYPSSTCTGTSTSYAICPSSWNKIGLSCEAKVYSTLKLIMGQCYKVNTIVSVYTDTEGNFPENCEYNQRDGVIYNCAGDIVPAPENGNLYLDENNKPVLECNDGYANRVGTCDLLDEGETGFNSDGSPICGDGYETTIINGEQFCTPKQETPDNSYCGSQQNALNILGNICKGDVNSSTINPDQNGCYNSLTYSCGNGEIGTVEITQDFITGTGDGGGTSPTTPTDPDTSTGTGGTTTDPTNPDTDTGTSTGGTTTDPIDPSSPDSGDSTGGTGTASGGTTGGGSTGGTDEEAPNVIFPDDDFVPDPVDTLPEGNTASSCDETKLTLTEMLLCEMNENLQDSDGTFPNALDDLKKSNNEAYKAMNNNIIGSNKRLDEIVDLERNNLQAQNISNGLISDVKDLLTPPADKGQSELDKLDTILDDETNFSEDIELTSDLKNTANGYFENYSNIFKNQLLALFSTFFSINTTGTQALGVPYNFTLAGRNFTGVFLDEQMFIELHMDKLAKIIIFGFSVLGFLHAFRFVIASKDN